MITSGPLEEGSSLVSIGLGGEVPHFPEGVGTGGGKSSDETPPLGTSICCRGSPKKKKKKKKKKDTLSM